MLYFIAFVQLSDYCCGYLRSLIDPFYNILMLSKQKRFGRHYMSEKTQPPLQRTNTSLIRQSDKLTTALKSTPNLSLTGSNQKVQYFSFNMQNLIEQTDPSKAFQYNVPTFSPNQRQLLLVTDQLQTTLVNYTGQTFPQSISIGLRGASGFIDRNGMVTNKIIVMNLSSISTSESQGIISRDLVYKSSINTMWNLGSLRNLILQIYVDEQINPIALPLSNPLAIAFKVIHVIV